MAEADEANAAGSSRSGIGLAKAAAGEDYTEVDAAGNAVWRPWWWALRHLDGPGLHDHVRAAGWTRVADDSGEPDLEGDGHARRGHLVFPTGVECMCCKFRWVMTVHRLGT